MKKIIAIILAALMLVGMFAGCTAEDNSGAGTNKYNLKTVKEGYLPVITSPDYAPYEFYALDENKNPTLMVGITGFFGSRGSELAYAMTGVLLVSIPMIIMFLFLQKYFIKGIAAGAVKG